VFARCGAALKLDTWGARLLTELGSRFVRFAIRFVRFAIDRIVHSGTRLCLLSIDRIVH
tara:strand:- start:277 stop:453 length:177 start_codon:yes stop_codon:yes gene_type:complete